ncbi:MAG: sigma-70 family RNA polymerase sigma factor [Candidatus Latescibacteria bacterium]|nr:sigma-70 family RNA polymerase sigma factor [Candidatus Latescibacterota bacterium]
MEEDRLLVKASLAGDRRAFARLLDRYRYAVYGLCLSYTQDGDAAEDLAQEAFIVAFLHLREFTAPHRFGPWLKTIAANQCRDWLQRQQQQRLDPLETMPATDPQSPLGQITDRETRQSVQDLIGRLTQPQREVVTLFYLDEMSLQQIAAFLGLSVPSVKQRLYRARRRLQELVLEQIGTGLAVQKLPDDFTERALAAALERGRQLLQERRWDEAKAEFYKIAASISHHREARRGLGLALQGAFQERVRAPEQPHDEALLKETLDHLQEAYRLGARDRQTAWALAGLYQYFEMEKSVRFLEGYSGETDDPLEALEAAGTAANHAVCSLRDYEWALALHRRVLALVDTPLKERLRWHLNPAILTAHLKTGRQTAWSQQAEELYRQLGETLTEQHFMYHLDRVDLERRTGQIRASIQTCQDFIDRLQRERGDDPVQRRFWISDMWAEIAKSHHALGAGPQIDQTLNQAHDNLEAYRVEWRAAVQQAVGPQRDELDRRYRRCFDPALHNLGFACMQIDRAETAEKLFARAQRLRETPLRCMCLAALRLHQGDRAGSLAQLQYINEAYKDYVLSGGARGQFGRLELFAPVWADAEFLALTDGSAVPRISVGNRQDP